MSVTVVTTKKPNVQEAGYDYWATQEELDTLGVVGLRKEVEKKEKIPEEAKFQMETQLLRTWSSEGKPYFAVYFRWTWWVITF